MTPAVRALEAAGQPFRVVHYTHDSSSDSYGIEAAEALGLDGSLIFKTLLVCLPDDEIVVGIVPSVTQLDLKALARAAGAKTAEMADPVVAQRRSGYVLGGISPFGQRQRHRTLVDESAELYDELYVSGGRRGLELAISPISFVSLLDARFADLTSAA